MVFGPVDEGAPGEFAVCDGRAVDFDEEFVGGVGEGDGGVEGEGGGFCVEDYSLLVGWEGHFFS